jgi:hypothetical protein
MNQIRLDFTQFTGTQCYYRVSRQFVVTDGCKYLAENAACYWLFDTVSCHIAESKTEDWFILVRLEVADSRAVLSYEDGNGNVYARQEIEYTDFPLDQITLYACWDGERWVLMLPSEY